MNLIDKLKNLPDVSFINHDTLEDTMDQLKGWYEDAYFNEVGEKITLLNGDPEKLKLDAVGMLIHQVKEYIDFVGKQNLIKYATGAFLENITASLQIFRKEGTSSAATVRFQLSSPREEVYLIPAGTRCATEDDMYFTVIDNVEIEAGELYKDVKCACETVGIEGEGYLPGEINILVDALPYIESVQNIDTSAGGTDPESDDDLAERFLLAPSAFNAWGGEPYYVYHVKNCNRNIGDIVTDSPEPCITNISFIMNDGSLPDDTVIKTVQEYINNVCVREIGDVVTVKRPDSVEFEIDIKYFINESDRKNLLSIHDEVQKAVDEYIRWQTEKFGRDINPDMLLHFVMSAGAKRVVIKKPGYSVLTPGQIAVCQGSNCSYGGMEDD